MPPFVNTNCTHCTKPNRFDLAELRKKDGSFARDVMHLGEDRLEEEFTVTCENCGKKFKFIVKGGDNGKKK